MQIPQPETSVAEPAQAVAVEPITDGDCWDEDINEHIGFIDLSKGIPAQLTVAYQSYYYTFKIDSRAPIPQQDLEPTAEQPALGPTFSESRGAGAEKVTKEMIDLARELDNSGKGITEP